MSETYTCAACGETYEKEWSDEEARDEAEAIWGAEELEDVVVICDDCFKRGMAKVPPRRLGTT
jgi:hypothetical protein